MTDKVYTSFGGTDITAVFNNTVFGELQMVKYNVQREKAPVYTMGSVDPRSIARGKRIITGACVFIVFDKDTLLNEIAVSNGDKVYLSADEKATYMSGKNNTENGVRLGGSLRTLSGTTVGTGNGLPRFKTESAPQLADQMLPFDITLVGESEYGKSIKMEIIGVELMNESGGVSIDDISLEKQVSFIARRVTPWTSINASTGAPIRG